MIVLAFGETINRCTEYKQKFLLQETWSLLKPEEKQTEKFKGNDVYSA